MTEGNPEQIEAVCSACGHKLYQAKWAGSPTKKLVLCLTTGCLLYRQPRPSKLAGTRKVELVKVPEPLETFIKKRRRREYELLSKE